MILHFYIHYFPGPVFSDEGCPGIFSERNIVACPLQYLMYQGLTATAILNQAAAHETDGGTTDGTAATKPCITKAFSLILMRGSHRDL